MNQRTVRTLHGIESGIAVAAILLLALIPTAEIILRKLFRSGIPASAMYVYHLVLLVTFLGGTITSREGRHLSISAGVDLVKGPLRNWIEAFSAVISVAVTSALFWSSISFIMIGFSPGLMIGVIPIRIAALIMPVGYGIMTVRFVTSKKLDRRGRILTVVGFLAGAFAGISPIVNMLWTLGAAVPPFLDGAAVAYYQFMEVMAVPAAVVIIAGAALGTPLFIVIAGIAFVLFSSSWGSLEVIPNEAYTMLTSSSMPALPLFTLTGYLLSESKAGERLVRLFRSFFGWLPGGLAIMAVLVCTFFTTFTGASGVTILALGALLSFILVENGSKRETAIGLLTASGSVGLFFPPSLPIILYGVVAGINIKNLFVGGILPGVVMIIILSLMGYAASVRTGVKRTPFDLRAAAAAVRESIWEIMLPVVILLGFFLGFTTLVETSAIAVIYSFIVVVLIHRDLDVKELVGTVLRSLPVIGGILVILAVSRGLSYYIVDAEVPVTLSAWVVEHIGSKYVFLILLNIALLITGSLMDIFSAIVVVVPLIIPLGEIFGIHPVHLGIIFLANLELGYLTPPVGLNLFLASYRFEEPLLKVYRSVLPYFGVRLVAVILITYVPWIATGLLSLGGG